MILLSYLFFVLSLGISVGHTEDKPAEDQEVFDDKRGDVSIDQGTLDKAENAFFEGLAAFRAKKYEEAAKQFKNAHALIPYRDLLFNIARSYEELKENDQAVEYYQEYLKTKPIDETQVIHRMRQLGVSRFETKTDSASTVSSTSKEEDAQVIGQTDYLSWSVIGGGVLLIGVGSYFGLNALDEAKTARETLDISEYEKSKEAAESSALITDVSLALGIATLAGGIYLMLSDTSSTTTMNQEIKGPKLSQNKFRLERKSKPSVFWHVIYRENLQGFGISGLF
jgi:tetratricopeptide (TPR) repeat protein